MPQIHRAPFRVSLCPSLEMRYSISVSAAPKEKYACGYLNRARYYFYNPALKKQVGKEWQATYPFTKKAIKAAKGDRPSVYVPKDTDLQEALENLMNRNTDLLVAYRKTKRGKPVSVQLNTDELLVFWVTQFSSIYNLVTSSQSPEDLNKRMAKVFMNPQIASFDLASLVSIEQDLLESACKSLVSQVKKTITGSKSDLTIGVNQTVLLIRYAVSCYLTGKKVNPEQALGILLRETRIKEGTEARVATAMRLKSMPIGRYRELWDKLTQDNNPVSTALLVMIFLGLKSEEVCGLQIEDFRTIPDRPGFYQLRVTHKISIEQARKYSLEILDDERACRNIPLPFQIRRLVKPLADNASEASVYLFRNGDHPLDPKLLDQKLTELLETPSNDLSIKTKRGKKKEVNVAFHARSYRESCRYYWQYHCGLTEGEVCYLAALSPPDTAAGHYIDFNNGSMQYRMLKQMEYGLALFASQDRYYKPHRDWHPAPEIAFYSSGMLDKRASMDIHITPQVIGNHSSSKVQIEISSNRGIMVYMEGESDS